MTGTFTLNFLYFVLVLKKVREYGNVTIPLTIRSMERYSDQKKIKLTCNLNLEKRRHSAYRL